MNPIRRRRAALAAALGTLAIAAPLAGAGAARADGIAAAGWGGTPGLLVGTGGPLVGQTAAVIGPSIITTAPATFINTSNQVTAGGAWSGGQASGTAIGNG
ncbi:hypothetical protein [Candidatus Solirubrobacter pratensis]|uniref:hypothetical protein n=1 Tax=Candidatus Solirubrobacter pratensis TaxID=1298857 RepID=UPI0004143FF6|nr:hypothetical protein [Candidatus Solirubrobacter pratensis]